MPASISISHFEKLKKEFLKKAGITTVSANDCKLLSLTISKHTGGSVSETTIKRIYGFAISRFFPSMYTLNQIALCCGYASWEEFSNHESAIQSTANNHEFLKFRKDAENITDFTIRALQNKSGIPYSYTVSRKSISEQIDHFSYSNSTCALISAPAGYGKTIGLCHWAEEKLESIRAGHSEDILLFFSNDALLSALLTGRDMNDWLLYLLGFGDHREADILLKSSTPTTHKFYLVIDGLDEFSLKGEYFRILTEQVKLLLLTYKDHPWFKMIISMRPSTWSGHRHLIETEAAGSIVNLSLSSFEPAEIIRLASRLNPAVRHVVREKWLEYFQYPLFFQYYYKLNKGHFTLDNTGHLLVYELVSNFILHKIYLAHNADEKLFLMHRLVLEMDLRTWDFTADKFKLSPF